MDYIPNGVRLTAHHGEAVELAAEEFCAPSTTSDPGLVVVPIGHV
jgi:hypothetical protein